MFIPKAQEIYKHFKGNLYQIMVVAEHSETGEQLVVYQALYGDYKVYARPLAMFLQKVDREKYPDVTQEYRFELVNGEDPRKRACSAESMPQAEESTAEVKIAETLIAETVTAEAGMEKNMTVKASADEQSEEELNIDPMVLEFLDADSYESRLNILAGLRHRITDEMLTTMAIVCDIELPEADVTERYEALRAALLTKDKYECSRMR